MKIYSWNVNGIRAVVRKDALKPFIAAEAPDILCLQETKAQADEIDPALPEYHTYVNSAEKKGYSGTAILSKTEPLSTSHGLPDDIKAKYAMTDDAFGDPNTEGRVLTAEYPDFYVLTVYTPNAKDDLGRLPLRRDHWDPAFLEYAKTLEKTKPVIFCGDLNVAHTELDLANPKPNKGKKALRRKNAPGSRPSSTPASWIPSGCSSRGTVIILGGVISGERAPATLVGASITFWCLPRSKIKLWRPTSTLRSWAPTIAP